jgi:uncharacterized protein YjlB
MRSVFANPTAKIDENKTNAAGSVFSCDIALHMQPNPMVKQDLVEPEHFRFKDDGVFPNSDLPLLVYRQAFTTESADRASIIEECFAENDWTNSWRNGVYSFAHYHSTAHEVLGVYDGFAKLRLGGERGQTVEICSGDVILIPAGVAHQNIGASPDFAVVGAYPDGRHWDLLRGLPGERPKSDHTIAALPIPDYDPIYGAEGPLRQIWKDSGERSK